MGKTRRFKFTSPEREERQKHRFKKERQNRAMRKPKDSFEYDLEDYLTGPLSENAEVLDAIEEVSDEEDRPQRDDGEDEF